MVVVVVVVVMVDRDDICHLFPSQNLQNLQPLDDCLIGQTKENKKKNRYKNIVPCEAL